MAKILLGKARTDANGRATFTYTARNAGIVGITAVADNCVSNELKILDYDLQAVTDVGIEDGVMTVDSIPSEEIGEDTSFVVDINYENGELEITKNTIDIISPESIISEIDIDDGVLLIRDIQTVLRWL